MSRPTPGERRPERRIAVFRCNLCRRVFGSRSTLQRHCLQNEAHLQLKWEKEQTTASSVARDQAIPCGLCHQPFETDKPITLARHLQAHYLEFKGRHYCFQCDVYFVHQKDLESHHRWAAIGSCGMKFDHNRHCTGHHPPRHSKAREQDRLNFCTRLRQWEKAQLDAFKTSVNALVKARNDAEEARAREKVAVVGPRSHIDHLLEGMGTGAMVARSEAAGKQDGGNDASDAERKAAVQRVWMLANVIAVYQQRGWSRDEIGAALRARMESSAGEDAGRGRRRRR